jgi:hypothetical protein
MAVSSVAHSSTLKIEVTSSSNIWEEISNLFTWRVRGECVSVIDDEEKQ